MKRDMVKKMDYLHIHFFISLVFFVWMFTELFYISIPWRRTVNNNPSVYSFSYHKRKLSGFFFFFLKSVTEHVLVYVSSVDKFNEWKNVLLF